MPNPKASRPRTQARGDRARRAVVEAMGDLLANQQIAELSVAQIAASAGIDRSVFYFYFRDKHAALRAALSEVVDEITVAAFPERKATEPVEDYIGRVFASAAVVNFKYVFLIRAAIEVRSLDPELDHLLEAALRRFTDLMVAVVEDETARSHRQPTEDVVGVVRTLVGMTATAAPHVDLIAIEGDVTRAISAVSHIWVHALWPAPR